VIRELAGHADIRTTTVNAAVSPARLDDAVDERQRQPAASHEPPGSPPSPRSARVPRHLRAHCQIPCARHFDAPPPLTLASESGWWERSSPTLHRRAQPLLECSQAWRRRLREGERRCRRRNTPRSWLRAAAGLGGAASPAQPTGDLPRPLSCSRLACSATMSCEHVFVTSQGSPYARFQRALPTGNAHLAWSAATELQHIDPARLRLHAAGSVQCLR
jgi:hypothetical protein